MSFEYEPSLFTKQVKRSSTKDKSGASDKRQALRRPRIPNWFARVLVAYRRTFCNHRSHIVDSPASSAQYRSSIVLITLVSLAHRPRLVLASRLSLAYRSSVVLISRASLAYRSSIVLISRVSLAYRSHRRSRIARESSNRSRSARASLPRRSRSSRVLFALSLAYRRCVVQTIVGRRASFSHREDSNIEI